MKQQTDSKGQFMTVYDKSVVWPDILSQIANGASLARAIGKCGMSYDLAKRHLRADPTLRQEYEDAVANRGDFLAEEIISIADELLPEGLQGRDASAWAQVQKLRIDARKWTSSRLRPRVWGERIEVLTHTQISITQALEAANARLNTIDMEPLDRHENILDQHGQ